MSKHRKHRESPVDASIPASPLDRTSHSSEGSLSRRVLLQLLAILGLSCVLGFTFNAASPIGIRFGEPVTPAPATVSVAGKVNSSAPPIASGVAPTNRTVALPMKPTNVVVVPPVPLPPAAKPVVASTPWSVSRAPVNTNPVVVAVPPPAKTNPAPIHWLQAKVLAAEGRGVLVDVRNKAVFDAGHIPGATSLPEASSPEEFKAFLSQLSSNTTVIVYCSSTGCSQSARVANRLVNEFLWPTVCYMTGGYQEYQQAELANPKPAPSP